MTATPDVTVLMPVYNAAPYLEAALDSMLRQTHNAFELIAIDDGSTDDSRAILERYRKRDARIEILGQAHQGLVAALNAGIAQARGALIARMDADDISLPRRLAAQAEHLAKHPDIGVCGCWVRSMGEPHPHTFRYETEHDAIVCNLPFGSPMPHAAALFRRDVISAPGGLYRDDYPQTEDYDLWIRLSASTRFANIPSVMYLYRQHAAQVTRSLPHRQRELRAMLLARLGIIPTQSESELHEAVSLWTFARDPATLGRIHAWLLRLLEANRLTRCFAEPAFETVLSRRWKTILHYFTRHGRDILQPYQESILQRHAARSVVSDMKLRLKFLMRYSR